MTSKTGAEREKRAYRRRSEEERIADLEARIAELKSKKAMRERKDDPLLREIPKIQKQLRRFAQVAMDLRRPDIANSTTAFAASLDRTLQAELETTHSRTPSMEDVV